jgi:hypothetical protein
MADTGDSGTGDEGDETPSGRGRRRNDSGGAAPDPADAPDIEFEPAEPKRTLPGADAAYAPVLWLVDRIATRVFGQPTTLRWTANPGDALRGEVEVVTVGVPAMRMAGLRLERVVGRVERVRIQPGLVPRLKGGPVSVKATVTQDSVDRWVGSANLPLRLELTADGILSSTGIGSLRVGHVLTELEVGGRWLRLRPRQVAARELPASIRQFLVGKLPLPPLPAGARLAHVAHAAGELAVRVALEDIDEAITPSLPTRMQRRLGGR